MKIFISYSRADEFIAERIYAELRERGADPILDAKNFEIGDSIADSIQRAIEDADEVVAVLSDSALKTDWVRHEISSAMALKKRIALILNNVSVDRLPETWNKDLACNLNDIQRYYGQVEQRIAATGRSEPPSPAVSPESRPLRPGDYVSIPEQPQPPVMGPKGLVSWQEEMTQHAGAMARVIEVDSDRYVRLKPGEGWWWAMDWLEPLPPQGADA